MKSRIKDKVDKQIYLRERPQLGNVDSVVDFTNYAFKDRTRTSSEYIVPIEWTKYYFKMRRKNFEPGWPDDIYKNRVIFSKDFMPYIYRMKKTSITQGDVGFSDTIQAFQSVAYMFTAKNTSGVSANIKIDVSGKVSGGYRMMRSEGDDGGSIWTGFPPYGQNIAFPDGMDATLILYFYYHPETNPSDDINNPDYIGFDTPINISVTFSNNLFGYEKGKLGSLKKPIPWQITSSADPYTRNIKNHILWYFDTSDDSDGTGIYREKVLQSNHQIDNTNSLNQNTFILSSASVSQDYEVDKTISYNGLDYKVLGAEEYSKNLIPNGNLSSDMNWTFVHTGGTGVTQGSTSYYKPIGYSNGGMIEFNINTTDTSKTAYMTTDTGVSLDYQNTKGQYSDTPSYNLNINFKPINSSCYPYAKLMYWSSNDGTLCSYASSKFDLIDTAGQWNIFNKSLFIFDTVNPDDVHTSSDAIPQNCLYIKPYLYLVDGKATCNGTTYVDSFTINKNEINKLSLYNASSQPLTAVTLNHHLTVPKNNRTLDIFTMATADGHTITGFFGHTAHHSSDASNQDTWSVSKFLSGNKFTGGRVVRRPHIISANGLEESYNYVKDGSFTASFVESGYSHRVNLSTPYINNVDLDSAIFDSRVCQIKKDNSKVGNQGLQVGYGVKTAHKTGKVSEWGTAWSLSFWVYSNDVSEIKIGMHGLSALTTEGYHSAYIGITNKWQRYTMQTAWSQGGGSDVLVYGFVGHAEDQSGTIYIDGLQVERGEQKAPVSSFLQHTDNTPATQITGYGPINIHSANTLFNNYGNFSFFWTPQYDSSQMIHSASYRKIVLWERYSTASNYMNIQWHSTISGYRMTQVNNSTTRSMDYPNRQFYPNIPVYFGIRWNADMMSFNVGTASSLTASNLGIAPVDTMWLGADSARGFYADGTYCNLRMDTSYWDTSVAHKQAGSDHYSPNSYPNASFIYNPQFTHVADVPKRNTRVSYYIDEDELQNNQLYRYYLDAYDLEGNRSDLTSSPLSINAGDTTAPTTVTDTGYIMGENFIRYHWRTPNDRSITHAIVNDIYNDIMYRITCPHNSTVYWQMDNVEDSSSRPITVYLSDAWNNFDDSNLATITGWANPEGKNLIINGGFEHLNELGTPSGWDKCHPEIEYDSLRGSGYYMKPFGKRASYLYDTANAGVLVTYNVNHFNIPYYDSSTKLCISAYAWKNRDIPIRFGLVGLGRNKEVVDSITQTLQYKGADSSVSYDNGDENSWFQLHTVIGATIFGTNTDQIDTWQFKSIGGSIFIGQVFIDNVQVEYGSTPSGYKYSSWQGEYKYRSGSIPGDAIKLNAISGNQLYNSILNIDNTTAGGAEVVIGKKDVDSAYVSMTPTSFVYSPPNSSDEHGFTKTVQSGVALFSEQVNFDEPFYTMDSVRQVPHLMWQPVELLVSSSGESGDAGTKLEFFETVTAGGFHIDALLLDYHGVNMEVDFNQFHTPDGSTATFVRALEDNPYNNKMSTALTDQSHSDEALLFTTLYSDLNRPTSVKVSVWGTSQASTSFGYNNTWYELHSTYVALSNGVSGVVVDFAIHTANMASAQSLGFLVHTPPAAAGALIQAVNWYPDSIIYDTKDHEIYASATDIGRFKWTAFDGGDIL